MSRLVPLAHSRSIHPPGASRRDETHDQEERIQVTVVLRARKTRDERRKEIQQIAETLPARRQHLDREEFIHKFGATESDVDAVAAFADAHGLTVVDKSPGRRCVVVSGRVADIDRAFGVDSGLYEWESGVYRSHDHPVHVPEILAGVVLGVLGLDNRPLTHPQAATGAQFQFTDRDSVMEEYGFPPDADGRGQRIGIIALGGGFHDEDVKSVLTPGQNVHVVELDGQENVPADRDHIQTFWELMKRAWSGETGPPPDHNLTQDDLSRFKWTIEVTSDVENAARFAGGADIVVYFAPDTVQGKYTAFTTALVDEYSPSVISCSWGTDERSVSKNHAYVVDDVFSFAALRGVTLCFSSGDHGDGSTAKDSTAAAHFPASSPFVLACGGTMPAASGDAGPEVVWDETLGTSHLASGGGVSETFGRPWWQAAEMVERKAGGRKGRGLPDVAGKADMKTGFKTIVGGIDMPIGGTSSVAPMWAALVARVNQKLGTSVGFVNPLLYRNRERFVAATTSITHGTNGVFEASEGWDACTGWGTPIGSELIKALSEP